MRKNVKKEVENLVYKTDDISLHRIDDTLHLFGSVDFTTNDAFDIIIWGIENKIVEDDFWNIRLTAADRLDIKPINYIYWVTGSDNIWKVDNWIWKSEWSEMSGIFLEHFNDKILRAVKAARTLRDLRNKMTKITSEDFYEMGIMLDLINKDETLL